MRSGFGGSGTDQEVTAARTGPGHNARREYGCTSLDWTYLHYGFAVCLHSASRWTASAVHHQLAARGHNRSRRNEESMTGLERLIAKVSNSTTQAMRGVQTGVVSRSWGLAEIRQEQLEEIDLQERQRRFETGKRQWRRMVHFGCE